jgi:hypothetical protein
MDTSHTFEFSPTFLLSGSDYSKLTFDHCIGCDRVLVTVSPKIDQDWTDAQFDTQITTVNFDNLSTWYKL